LEIGLVSNNTLPPVRFKPNLAKLGVPRRTAMSVMRHSDGKLMDKIYTDEKLFGIETAIDALLTFTETPAIKKMAGVAGLEPAF
jgi:hypothetical protein